MPLTLGTRLGPYEIIAPLGAGGMGEVCRAQDTSLGRDVALKVLLDAWSANAAHAARFEREARTLATLHHPNVATLFGFHQVDGVRFLTMELVEGETFMERLARGPIPVKESLEILEQVAEGLEEAHERGVVHCERDIGATWNRSRQAPSAPTKSPVWSVRQASASATPWSQMDRAAVSF